MIRPGGQFSRVAWPILLLLLLAGCVGRVMPPAAPLEPVTVHLLDHGRHASLVVPDEAGRAVRYSYGEWRWYVEARRHALTGAAALLWPTDGALGRGVHDDWLPAGQVRRLAPEGVAQVYSLEVERWRVEALRRRLDAHFEAPGVVPVYSAEFDLEFVPYPRPYWFPHQSNLVTASWLRALGVEVQGIPWLSRWQLHAPPH